MICLLCRTVDVSAAICCCLVWLESEGIYLAADLAGLVIGDIEVFQRHSGEMLCFWHNTEEGDIAADLKLSISRMNLRHTCNNKKIYILKYHTHPEEGCKSQSSVIKVNDPNTHFVDTNQAYCSLSIDYCIET